MGELKLEQIRDFVIVLMALLAFIILIWNAVKAFREWRKPSTDAQSDLQSWRRDVDQKLNRDNDRLNDLEKSDRVILRGINAMLSHEINGNSKEKLLESQKEITNYLIDR